MNIVARVKNAVALRFLNWAYGQNAKDVVHHSLQQAFGIALGDRHPRNVQQGLVNTGWVFAANRQIAGRGVKVEPILELVTRGRGKVITRTAVHEHAFLSLLQRPNLDESGKQFLWRQLLQLNTYGVSYVAVEPKAIDLSPLGIPHIVTSIDGLRLLEPERTRPISTPERMAAAFFYTGVRGEQRLYLASPTTWKEREDWKRNPYAFAFRVIMPSPDSYDGQSVTQAAFHSINVSEELFTMYENQIKNALHSGLIFTLDRTDLTDKKRFEEAVLMLKSGSGKAGEPLILPKWAKVSENPMKMSEMQYPVLSEMVRQQQLSILGVSDAMIGITHDGSNRANMEALAESMALGTVDPMLDLFADGYNNHLLPLYPGQSDGSFYRMRYPTSLQSDETVKATNLKLLVDGSIMTPNEAREQYGLKPLPDGNDLMGGTKQQPISLLADLAGTSPAQLDAQEPEDGSGQDDTGSDTDTPPDDPSQPGKQGGGAPAADLGGGKSEATPAGNPENRAQPVRQPATPMTGDAGSGGAMIVGKPAKKRGLKAGHRLHDDGARRDLWKRNDRVQRGFEKEIRKRVAKVFARWQDDFISKVKKHGPAAIARSLTRDVDIDGGPTDDAYDIAPWAEQLAKEYRPWARAVLINQITTALTDYGISADGANEDDPRIDRFIDRRSAAFGKQVAQSQADRLRDAMTDAVADGASISDVTDMSDEWFPNANASATRRIGATEGTIASGAGLFAGAQQIAAFLQTTDADADSITQLTGDALDSIQQHGSGNSASENLGLQWLSQRDDKVRDSHAEVDGSVVLMGEMFAVGDEQMLYPGDDENCGDPGELCNCRCNAVVVPVDDSEDDDDGSTDDNEDDI